MLDNWCLKKKHFEDEEDYFSLVFPVISGIRSHLVDQEDNILTVGRLIQQVERRFRHKLL